MNSGLSSLGRLLIANRGEIAARILRSAGRLGMPTAAVYTGADRDAPYLRQAGSAFFLGEEPGLHLDIARHLEAARATGAGAVHPGYGFLAENADFAQACEEAGLVFVGPPAAAMRLLGDKSAAKKLAAGLGVPCVPGSAAIGPGEEEKAAAAAAEIGYPLLIKAAAGGGGRGMRVVREKGQLAAALRLAASEALAAFGRGDLLLESFLEGARHVEVQVLADAHGKTIHLGERDCSVQRRFQKLIEESPSPGACAETRKQLGEAAVRLVAAAGYCGAATVELLLLPDGRFFFLEVNTRLQVEHGVTELRTGLDLVEWQLRIAAGESLPFDSESVAFAGHAIEARLCAEDAANLFLPQTGRIAALALPDGARVDHALEQGMAIGGSFDSLLAKILVHAGNREEARRRLIAALEGTFVAGLETNKSFLLAALESEDFRSGQVSTRMVEEKMQDWRPAEPPEWLPLLAAAWRAEKMSPCAGTELWAFRSSGQPAVFYAGNLAVECLGGRRYRVQQIEIEIRGEKEGKLEVEHEGVRHQVFAAIAGDQVYLGTGGATHRFDFSPRRRAAQEADPRQVRSPMASRVKALQVVPGQEIEAGQPLLVLEAMKLEHRLEAAIAGKIAAIHVAAGEAVDHRQLLIEIG
jgi:geranyl-CoA carboxylase alpha subunit